MKLLAQIIASLASPNIVRGIMYVAIVIGSCAVFAGSMHYAAIQLTGFVVASAGTQKPTVAPRADVPLPTVVQPTANAPQVAKVEEPPVPESSIVTLAAPAATEPSETIAVVPPAAGDGETLRVVSDVTIRALPDKNGVALGSIGTGELVVALNEQDGWIQIAQNGSVLGWVYGRYLGPAE